MVAYGDDLIIDPSQASVDLARIDMAWARPLSTSAEMDAVGEVLIDASASADARSRALSKLNSWRSAHGFPLNSIQMLLRSRAGRIGGAKPVVAQRLKRLQAIESKLRRFKNLKLGHYQDIGGCRAVLRNVSQVQKLIQVFKSGGGSRHELFRENDYITHPKADGYRSHHLVYRYDSASELHRLWNGILIEIQVRSQAQHMWAAAVETAGFITGQSLKSGSGSLAWRRFFALASSVLAREEAAPTVPGTPENPRELVAELKSLDEGLGAVSMLAVGGVAVDSMVRNLRRTVRNADYFLLEVDYATKRISVGSFLSADSGEATDAYAEAEQRIAAQPGVQVVLVRAQSLSAAIKAYPSFFLDTSKFCMAIVREIS